MPKPFLVNRSLCKRALREALAPASGLALCRTYFCKVLETVELHLEPPVGRSKVGTFAVPAIGIVNDYGTFNNNAPGFSFTGLCENALRVTQ